MIRLVENFKEFMDLASINQGPRGWSIYGSNPNKELAEKEKVSFPELGLTGISAKVDTGADGSSIDANDIKMVKDKLTFWIKSPSNRYEFSDFDQVKVKNSFGKTEERYRIRTSIKIGDDTFKIRLSLTNRDKMKFPCILGKNVISKGGYKVDITK